MGKDARSGVPGLGLWGKTTSGTDFFCDCSFYFENQRSLGGGVDVVNGGLSFG